MEIIQLTVGDCYFKELSSDTFEQSNSNFNKIMNSYMKDPQILFTWINEMSDKKVNTPAFKSMADGKNATTKLYADGCDPVYHHSRMFITSNNMINIKIDTGTKRRIFAYETVSEFVEDKKLVNHKQHKYLKNFDLKDELVRDNLLDAFIDILVEYCVKWLQDKRVIKMTKGWIQAKDTILESNDIMADFIDANIILTKNDGDKIGKAEMHEMFQDCYPDKHLTVQQLISDL